MIDFFEKKPTPASRIDFFHFVPLVRINASMFTKQNVRRKLETVLLQLLRFKIKTLETTRRL